MPRTRLWPPSRRQVRVALGLIWLLDAALQAAPALFSADWWRTDLAQSVMGEPMAVNRSIFWAVHVISAHAAIWDSTFIAIQASIGLALVLGRFERAAIIASIPWALGIWWVGEGFGTLPTGFALAASGSPGPVLLYPLIALLAWPGRDAAGAVQGSANSRRTIAWRSGAAAWVVLWAGQALLQIPWRFPIGQVLVANVEEYSQGQPGWLSAIARATEALARQYPVALGASLAIAQVAIGVGVLHPRGRRGVLVAGIAVSLVFWICFQYLGTIPGGDATDPGSAPLMILLAVALWPAVPVSESRRRRAMLPAGRDPWDQLHPAPPWTVSGPTIGSEPAR